MVASLNLTADLIECKSKFGENSKFEAGKCERHQPCDNSIVIAVKYTGVCHSDVHACEGDNASSYPCTPGHEIAGTVEYVGSNVKGFKVGDKAGIGCMVDSCLDCEYCNDDEEQYCEKGATMTYGSEPKHGRAGKEKTRGGYSTVMTVHERFAIKIPDDMPLEVAGPIMCAGITVYDPLKHWNAGSDRVKRIGIVGGGGLGHMGIQLAKALGCEVTAITTSPDKEPKLKELGASRVLVSTDEECMKGAAKSLDLILNTISANHDIMLYHNLLRNDGTLVQLGLVQKPHELPQTPLIFKRAGVSGSLIGGIKNTQEVIDLCQSKKIYPTIEVVPVSKINDIFHELQGKNTMPRRYVLDIANTMSSYSA